MHGYALEQLHSNLETPGSNILDVGCGSGYLSAVMARFTPDSTVIGIDIYPDLIELSKKNVKKGVRYGLQILVASS
jgi:protein-L-isoaspartate(D-aspartate) O-methyltransferase